MKTNLIKRLLVVAMIMGTVLVATAGCGTKTDKTDGGISTAESTSEDAVSTTTEASYEEANVSQPDEPESSMPEPSEVQPSESTAESSKPTPPPQPQVAPWKTAYKNYLKDLQGDYVLFSLIYLDNNDIPELFAYGSCEAAGEIVATYSNGKVNECFLHRLGGAEYTERSGHITNFNGNMGYYTAKHFILSNGNFTLVDEGLQEEAEYDETIENFIYNFSINGASVSQDEFFAAMNNWLPSGNVKSPSGEYDYNGMVSILSK